MSSGGTRTRGGGAQDSSAKHEEGRRWAKGVLGCPGWFYRNERGTEASPVGGEKAAVPSMAALGEMARRVLRARGRRMVAGI